MENVLFQRNARMTARTSKHVIFKYREYIQMISQGVVQCLLGKRFFWFKWKTYIIACFLVTFFFNGILLLALPLNIPDWKVCFSSFPGLLVFAKAGCIPQSRRLFLVHWCWQLWLSLWPLNIGKGSNERAWVLSVAIPNGEDGKSASYTYMWFLVGPVNLRIEGIF